jgi:hypothetical protein
MKGRRLSVVDGKMTMPDQPGDYCGPVVGYTGDKPAVFFLKPHARDPGTPAHGRGVQHVVSPPHVFTEEEDGTLTITASIGDTRTSTDSKGHAHTTSSDGWHGYLTRGEWVKV